MSFPSYFLIAERIKTILNRDVKKRMSIVWGRCRLRRRTTFVHLLVSRIQGSAQCGVLTNRLTAVLQGVSAGYGGRRLRLASDQRYCTQSTLPSIFGASQDSLAGETVPPKPTSLPPQIRNTVLDRQQITHLTPWLGMQARILLQLCAHAFDVAALCWSSPETSKGWMRIVCWL